MIKLYVEAHRTNRRQESNRQTLDDAVDHCTPYRAVVFLFFGL